MPICSWCGKEFDLERARRSIGRSYGAGYYDDSFPQGDACPDCARTEINNWIAAGNEIMELNGEEWEDD